VPRDRCPLRQVATEAHAPRRGGVPSGQRRGGWTPPGRVDRFGAAARARPASAVRERPGDTRRCRSGEAGPSRLSADRGHMPRSVLAEHLQTPW